MPCGSATAIMVTHWAVWPSGGIVVRGGGWATGLRPKNTMGGRVKPYHDIRKANPREEIDHGLSNRRLIKVVFPAWSPEPMP
ncbi:hypothetical protein EDB85DRAFT_1988358 [Lactarius pseudohatsudake]|nr:hypothetical protein EDB85DRAFT_1988358 [Lactarius pseudohatsudake]